MGYGVRKVIILLYLNGFNITICLLPSLQRCFMKLPYLLVYGGIGLLTMSSSCDKEAQEVNPAPCSDAEIMPVPGFNWTLPAYCFKEPIAVIGQSKHYVIHSAAEYSAVATCSPPALNYGNVSLLFGKTKTAYTSRVVSQLVTRTCTGVRYTINLENGAGTAISEVAYYAVVPRLASDATVEFDVRVR